MKTISYYISMVVILAATIFTGCTDDDEKSLSPRAGELSIYDFAPNTGTVNGFLWMQLLSV